MSKYKCMFFKDRVCHVREQMDIDDEKLREDKILIERAQARRMVQDEEINYDVHRTSRHVADWLVNEFCGRCPHRRI